jgi:EmrB/QacA subfamily drug resistance transporter
MTNAATASRTEKLDPATIRLGLVVVLGAIMTILDTTIVNVALDTLAHELHASITGIQWVVTGYMLALAAVIPLSGWAARRFGIKQVWITSLVLFTAGSALCGVAQSTTELIVFRVIQGIGGGMVMPVGQMMLAQAAGPKRMGRVMSIIGVPMMLAPVFGPTIGGLILQNLSWRWIFYVNVPIGIAAVIAGLRALPATHRQPTEHLDVLGLALMCPGLPLIIYGLAEVGTGGSFGSTKVLVPAAIGLVLMVLFGFHAMRAKRPLLQLHLYRRPTFASASLVTFMLGAALFGSMILLPLYWQSVRHVSVIDTGLLVGPQGLGTALMLPLVGRLTDRYGGGIFALAGVALTAVTTLPFAFIGAHTSIVYLEFALLLRGFGLGMAMMPAMTAAFASLKHEEVSDATPQLNVLQRVGGSFGTAILAVVLQRALTGSHTLAGAASGYGTAFWWSIVMLAVALPACAWLLYAERRVRAREDGGDQHDLAPAGDVSEVAA